MGKKKDKKNEILDEAEAAKKLEKKRKKKAKKAKKVRVAERIEEDDDEQEASSSKREKIGELLDHPLVADVVAAGAVAAVAALAENRATSARGVKSGSRDMLKVAGAAAAAAIGKRIKAEIDAAKAEQADENDED